MGFTLAFLSSQPFFLALTELVLMALFWSGINRDYLGIMVTVLENGHGDTSSNPGRALIPLGKV